MKKMVCRAALFLCLSTSLLPMQAQDSVKVSMHQEVGDTLIRGQVSGRFADEQFPGGWDFSIQLVRQPHHAPQRSKAPTLTFSVFNGVGLGWVSALSTPGNLSTQMGRSMEFDLTGLLNLRARFNKHHSVALGFGFDIRNYRMTGDQRFVEGDGGYISVQPYPVGASPRFSRVRIVDKVLDLKYRYRYRKMTFVVGPELAFSGGRSKTRSIKTRYKLAGESVKDVVRDIHSNSCRVNLYAAMGWRWLGVYMRYSPSDVLDGSYGPRFSSLSVGLKLFGL